MKKYYENLPRKIRKKIKCQCMDNGGNKCKSNAVWEVDAHLDHEIYHSGTEWVCLYLCNDHWMNSWWLWSDESGRT